MSRYGPKPTSRDVRIVVAIEQERTFDRPLARNKKGSDREPGGVVGALVTLNQ